MAIERYNVYAGADYGSIDYDTPVAQVNHPTLQADVSITDDETKVYVVRPENDGGEGEESGLVRARVDAGGSLVGSVPNAPADLSAKAIDAAKVELVFHYPAFFQEVAPAEFKVYYDNGGGSIDYGTPLATISYVEGRDVYSWTSGALSGGTTYLFAVRARSAADDEEQNGNEVSVMAISAGPPTQMTAFTVAEVEA